MRATSTKRGKAKQQRNYLREVQQRRKIYKWTFSPYHLLSRSKDGSERIFGQFGVRHLCAKCWTKVGPIDNRDYIQTDSIFGPERFGIFHSRRKWHVCWEHPHKRTFLDFDKSSSSRRLSTGDPSKGCLTANKPVPTARQSLQPRSSSVDHTSRTTNEQIICSETPQATSHALLMHRLANDESDQQNKNWYK